MLTFDNFARSTRPSFCQLAGYRWLPYGKRPSIYMYVGDACPHPGDFPHPIIPKAGIKQSADQGRGNLSYVRKRRGAGATNQSSWSSFGQSSMPVATTISTSSHHHRNQTYNSHPLRYWAHEDASISTVSDSSSDVRKSVVGRLRRVRAEACEIHPQERRLRAKGAMSSSYPRRTHSESKSKAKETHAKEPRVVVREARKRSDSEHRHYHRKSDKEDGKEGERVRVDKVQRNSEGEADRSKPSTLQRSTTNAGGASRARHERQRTDDKEVRRRHSERRPSHHEEKVHTPLRHEKRSIADHVPKSTRDRAPVTR